MLQFVHLLPVHFSLLVLQPKMDQEEVDIPPDVILQVLEALPEGRKSQGTAVYVHFMNSLFTMYQCRFEHTLLVLPQICPQV